MEKHRKLIFGLIASCILLFSTGVFSQETYSLSVEVKSLRNSEGKVLVAIYNKDGTVPDQKLEKYFKKKVTEIDSESAQVTFSNLPKARYAIFILHDENENGKIDKRFLLPIEGVGYSNYKDLGLRNRPNFKNASFVLKEDFSTEVKIIYK
ncbi:DUF2141 domain-containing protein [Salegentibacter sp.]|uniref:DUF2141 domain-containing protein n=1 Tax=Salegentibacter sp. TaxID=1903072 RepID=UPI00356AC4AD